METLPFIINLISQSQTFYCTNPRGCHLLQILTFFKDVEGDLDHLFPSLSWKVERRIIAILFILCSFYTWDDSCGYFLSKTGFEFLRFVLLSRDTLAMSSCFHPGHYLSLHEGTLCFIVPDSYQTSFPPTLAYSLCGSPYLSNSCRAPVFISWTSFPSDSTRKLNFYSLAYRTI